MCLFRPDELTQQHWPEVDMSHCMQTLTVCFKPSLWFVHWCTATSWLRVVEVPSVTWLTSVIHTLQLEGKLAVRREVTRFLSLSRMKWYRALHVKLCQPHIENCQVSVWASCKTAVALQVKNFHDLLLFLKACTRFMTLRTGEDTLIWKRRLWIALCGGTVLEEALALSSDRLLNNNKCQVHKALSWARLVQ